MFGGKRSLTHAGLISFGDTNYSVNTRGANTGTDTSTAGRRARAGYIWITAVIKIQKGDLDFTMDQQGWWRGYISVLELVHYIRYGLIQSNFFLTGPQIVDKANADAVAGLAAAGVR